MRRFRPHLLNVPPYTSARDEYAGTAEIFLDANENAFASQWSAPYHRYPDPHHTELRAALGAYLGVSPDSIMCGAGSDELIDWLLRAVCEPGQDELLTITPTYGVYATYARIHGIHIREIQLGEGFSLPVDTLLRAAGPRTPIAILCRPNNPTGTLWPAEEVQRFIDQFDGWIVLDEAYIEFSDEPAGWLPRRSSGTVILRTFSKAWGLAGWRIGYAVAEPEVVSLFYRTKLPYNLSGPAQAAAIAALRDQERIRQSIEEVRRERHRVSETLRNLPIVEEVFPSQANFILVRFQAAKSIYQALAERGIIVRYRGNLPLCENTLRITIGTPEENDKLIHALRELSAQAARGKILKTESQH
ncbi:MAG: histidinol-phosphate transaminase [Bacteroidia bacterium]